jgi:hypothetical protein
VERIRAPRRLALLLLILTLLAVPTVALANHFNDVGANDVHAPGIEYLADTGITLGCAPNQFCPNDPLTRAQMGSFLYRSSGNDPATPPSVNAASIAGVVVVDSDNTVGAGSTANPNTVACPAGTLAIGGGGEALIGWVLKDSHPLPNAAGWRIQHRTADGNPAPANSTNTVYAVCVPGSLS